MAKLKKFYYSITQNKFLNVLNLNNTQDIGFKNNSQLLRVLPFGAAVETLNLLQLVKDLLYNDIQLELESSQLSNVLSNGVFKNIGEEFRIIETISLPFIKKLKLLEGQIKINETIFFYNTEMDNSYLKGNIIAGSNIINGILNTQDIKVGMSLNCPEFPISTTVREILSINSIKVSENALVTAFNVNLNFKKEKSFELMDIGSNGDVTINSDIISNIKNIEDIYIGMHLFSPLFPSNTRVIEKIDSTTIKVSNNALNTQSNAFLNFSSNLINNNFYRRDTIQINSNQEIVFVLGEEFQEPSVISTQQEALDSNHYVIYSILSKKESNNSFIVEYRPIWRYLGLISSVIPITKALIDKSFDGLYHIETNDKIHLVNSNGQLLSWEAGQSQTSEISSLATGYTEKDLMFYERTQLPQIFDDLNSSSLVNIPFKVKNIQNIFNNSNIIPLTKIHLAMRNTILDYGDEGIEIEINSVDSVLPTEMEIDSVINGINTTIIINSLNFNSLGLNTDDFVLVTNGAGKYQIGRIVAISTNSIVVQGFTKPLSDTNLDKSSIQIFKYSTRNVIPNSNIFLTNSELVSQVLSGENGRFGVNNLWTKIAFNFPISPLISQNKWYFIRVKGYNMNPPTWGNLPYITIENPLPQLGDNKTKSAYFEVYYSLFSGIYPNGDFLLEDELGDLGEIREERLYAPHFRPIKYNLIANDLADLNKIPNFLNIMKENDIFVDVKSGRILFKEGFEPRKVFVSYRKINILNGDSSSNNLVYNSLENNLKTNIQNEFIEIDSRFKLGTTFQSNINTNGIKDNFLFKGTGILNERNVILNDEFDCNNLTQIKNYVSFNKHFRSNIISMSKKEIKIEKEINPLEEIPLNENEKFEIDSKDRIVIYSENLNNLKIKEFNEEERNYDIPSLKFDQRFTNKIKDFQIISFNDKDYYKTLLKLDFPSLNYLKKEEIKSALIIDNKIINENYFQNIENKEYFNLENLASIIPVIETNDYSQLEFFNTQNNQNLISNIIEYDCDLKDFLALAYITNTNDLKLDLYNVTKNLDSENEIDSLNFFKNFNIFNISQKIKVKTKIYQDKIFVLYSCLNTGKFELFVSIYDKNQIIKENILITNELFLENTFDFCFIENQIIIVWKKSTNEVCFQFLFLSDFSITPLNIFSNENILINNLLTFKLSDSIFGILTGAFGSLKLRLFDKFGKIVFINSNPFFEISNSVTPNSFDISIIKLSNNLIISFSEKEINNISNKLCILNENFNSNNIKLGEIEFENTLELNRISNVNLYSFNQNYFVLHYIKNNQIHYRLFNSNLIEYPINFIDSNLNKENCKVKASFFNSFISFFKINNDLKFDLFEIRPNFSNIIKNQFVENIENFNALKGKIIESQNFIIYCFNNTNEIKLTLFSKINKNKIKTESILTGSNFSNFDLIYLRNEANAEILLLAFIDSNDLKIVPINVYNTNINLIGTPLLITNAIINSLKFFKNNLYFNTTTQIKEIEFNTTNINLLQIQTENTIYVSSNIQEFEICNNKIYIRENSNLFFSNLNLISPILLVTNCNKIENISEYKNNQFLIFLNNLNNISILKLNNSTIIALNTFYNSNKCNIQNIKDSDLFIVRYLNSNLNYFLIDLNLNEITNNVLENNILDFVLYNDFLITKNNSNNLEKKYQLVLFNYKPNYNFDNCLSLYVINHNSKRILRKEIYREENQTKDYSLAIVKLNPFTIAVIYNDSRNKVFVKKYIIENENIHTIQDETILFPIISEKLNLHAHNLNNNKFLIIFNDLNTIKKRIYYNLSSLVLEENLEINIPTIKIQSITWISGNIFEISLNSTFGLEENQTFDIINDNTLNSFNSENELYTILSGTLTNNTFRFSHPTYNSNLFNKVNSGILKIYNYEFELKNSKKLISDYIETYVIEKRFNKHFINIYDLNGNLIHFGNAFTLFNVNDLKHFKIDSYGIITGKFNNFYFSYGINGNRISTILIHGYNNFKNIKKTDFPEENFDIVNLEFFNLKHGEEQKIIIKPNEIIEISNFDSLVWLKKDTDEIKIIFKIIILEMKKKLVTIFSEINKPNSIYIYNENEKLYIQNNFNYNINLTVFRKAL